MYRKAVNALRGEVTVRCRSEAPERIVNLCSARDIPFWGTVWEDDGAIRFRTTREGAARLKGAAADAAVDVETLSFSGIPARLFRLRRRYVLIAAVVLALLWLWCGSSVILNFTVSGNETVSDTAILRALEHNGVAVGTRGRTIQQEQLRNHVLLEMHDLSWLSVNVRGCTAHVQVVERQRPPARYDPDSAANVVAKKAGMVTQIRALNGVTMIEEGDVVIEGQLLLSGVSDGRFGGVRFMHACGDVWGRTWYTLTAIVPLEVQQQGETVRENLRISLIAGKKRINFFSRGSILGAGCDKITTYYPLRLPFGGELPLALCCERTAQYAVQTVRRSEESALDEGRRALLQRLTAQLDENGTVTDTRFHHRTEGDVLVVTLQAECCEQLGMEIPVVYGE